MQIAIVASFKKQGKDEQEQSTYSECDSLDNNEGFYLDNSASATNLDNMQETELDYYSSKSYQLLNIIY